MRREVRVRESALRPGRLGWALAELYFSGEGRRRRASSGQISETQARLPHHRTPFPPPRVPRNRRRRARGHRAARGQQTAQEDVAAAGAVGAGRLRDRDACS